MAHIVNNLHVFKSEILPKWMTKIFYPQLSMFVYDLQDCKLWNAAWWQEPAFDKTKLQISEWYTPLIVVWDTPAFSPRKY